MRIFLAVMVTICALAFISAQGQSKKKAEPSLSDTVAELAAQNAILLQNQEVIESAMGDQSTEITVLENRVEVLEHEVNMTARLK